MAAQNKKGYGFSLDEKSVQELHKLAEWQRLSFSSVIRSLIRDAYASAVLKQDRDKDEE